MIVSKKIHSNLVDVFFGDKEYRQQEWVRCAYTRATGWRINAWPVYNGDDDLEFFGHNFILKRLPDIYKYLVKTYGKQ